MPIFPVELMEYRKFTTTVYVQAPSQEDAEEHLEEIYEIYTCKGPGDWEPDFESGFKMGDGYVNEEQEDAEDYDIDWESIISKAAEKKEL